jgi:hypothetical protein
MDVKVKLSAEDAARLATHLYQSSRGYDQLAAILRAAAGEVAPDYPVTITVSISE